MAVLRIPQHAAARVRMYHVGLGDCFLVTIPLHGGRPFQLLVDCGVFWQRPVDSRRIIEVAKNIAVETNNRLDVVVVSHAHWDHVSGFIQGRDVFEDVTIGEVWLPWTENLDDAATRQSRQQRLALLGRLRVAVNRLENEREPVAPQLHRVLDLFGPRVGEDAHQAIQYLVGHRSNPKCRFLGAGDKPLDLPGVDGARAFVLGPARPVGKSVLGASVRDDFYGGATAQGFFVALGGRRDDTDVPGDTCQTFEPRYQHTAAQAEDSAFFRRHYLKIKDDWRRTDSAWLTTSAPLALALDSRMKDDSLALAIELEAGGSVLLFPGDAQLASWQAWSNLRWRLDANGRRVVTSADLLARTVIYKASHHGSITGTPELDGPGRMTSPDLVVMVPGCEATAQTNGWSLPSPVMLDRFRQRCRGRVLRSDKPVPDRPDGVNTAAWSNFLERVFKDDAGLFVDYTLSD